MIIKKYFDAQKHDVMTIEYENGEVLPVEGDVLYLPGEIDCGYRIGKELYNKYNVATYEIIEWGVEGTFDDPDNV